MDWLKVLGGTGTGVLGGLLGIGIPKGIVQVLSGMNRTVVGLAGLTDLGIGIAAAYNIPKQRDDFYRGALAGLAAWELLSGSIQLMRSIREIIKSGRIEYGLGGGKIRGSYLIRKD